MERTVHLSHRGNLDSTLSRYQVIVMLRVIPGVLDLIVLSVFFPVGGNLYNIRHLNNSQFNTLIKALNAQQKLQHN